VKDGATTLRLSLSELLKEKDGTLLIPGRRRENETLYTLLYAGHREEGRVKYTPF